MYTYSSHWYSKFPLKVDLEFDLEVNGGFTALQGSFSFLATKPGKKKLSDITSVLVMNISGRKMPWLKDFVFVGHVIKANIEQLRN